MEITVRDFGRTADGERVDAFDLRNDRGILAKVISYGATLATLELPDADDNVQDCVLGYDTVAEYERGQSYFGATVGRCASFIENSRFRLDGAEYSLSKNYGSHHIHGGTKGFSYRVWRWDTWQRPESVGVTLSLLSADGDQGYPGELHATVCYSLNNQNELRIDYSAATTKPTHVNLMNHTYFNLAGHDSGNVLDQTLRLACSRYLVSDDQLIPKGENAQVAGTPFDFRESKAIGRDFGQARFLYDHTFLCDTAEGCLTVAAEAFDLSTGRGIEVQTTEPSVHLYTAAHLREEPGKSGALYQAEQGFCLETQHYPNSPNRPEFPSTILRPEERYESTTVYRFFVRS